MSRRQTSAKLRKKLNGQKICRTFLSTLVIAQQWIRFAVVQVGEANGSKCALDVEFWEEALERASSRAGKVSKEVSEGSNWPPIPLIQGSDAVLFSSGPQPSEHRCTTSYSDPILFYWVACLTLLLGSCVWYSLADAALLQQTSLANGPRRALRPRKYQARRREARQEAEGFNVYRRKWKGNGVWRLERRLGRQ